MNDPAPRSTAAPRIGVQPVAIAAVALALVLIGIGSMALWRTYTGNSPETDRVVATRQLQARAAQASEQLVEKTKGLEATQQESIDQLQMVQDQLQTVRRLLAAQQAETKKLSEQVGTPDRSDRGLAAVLCQRPGVRTAAVPDAKTVAQGRSALEAQRKSKRAKARG